MITLALLIYAGFIEGVAIAPWMFIVTAIFDLAMAEEIFDSGE